MTDHSAPPAAPSERGLVLPALVLIVLAYFAVMGYWTATHPAPGEHAAAPHSPRVEGGETTHAAEDAAEATTPAAATTTVEGTTHSADPTHADDVHHEHAAKGEHASTGEHAADHAHDAHEIPPPPPLFMVVPFCLLLGAIAVFPLVHAMEHWWEDNLHKFYVAGGLAAVTLVYYLVLHAAPIHQHFLGHGLIQPTAGGLNWHLTGIVFSNSIFGEFIPFIILLFSLYTIAGGVRISGDLVAKPLTNTCILATGAGLASFVGTTGAAMLLIRLLIETNAERKHKVHTVVFFIFIVCNCGGLLLPLGDPPLFLGYLQGVPFFWTVKLLGSWLFVNGLLLGIYYLWDALVCYPQETRADVARDIKETRPLSIRGGINAVWLLGVIVAVVLLDPSKPLVGTTWQPWTYLREIAQLSMVALSLLTTPRGVRQENSFNYGAILEVGALFVGIFICMQPALQLLGANGAKLGIRSETGFFWTTGVLSSVLDNAPTYLVFYKTAGSLVDQMSPAELEQLGPLVTGVPQNLLAAVSLGAVLMGAMTYIGNGPNFMVKAIAEKSGVRMPSFFGYTAYSFGVLFPIFVLLNVLLYLTKQWVLW